MCMDRNYELRFREIVLSETDWNFVKICGLSQHEGLPYNKDEVIMLIGAIIKEKVQSYADYRSLCHEIYTFSESIHQLYSEKAVKQFSEEWEKIGIKNKNN